MEVIGADGCRGTFTTVSETRYVMDVADLGITFDLDRVRRERHELTGELLVRCALAGAKTVNGGILSVADFNLSGLQARTTRAKYLAERAQTGAQVDWVGLLEEFCHRVAAFSRQGSPDLSLADVPYDDTQDRAWYFDERFPVLQDHPMIWFGAGGTCKSFLALYLALQLAEQGVQVLYCDWELTERDHRQRLGAMHRGAALPDLRYARCERPLVEEADRIRRIIKERSIQYVICDSIAFATNGRPEEAEQANGYFRAVRSWGVGSLHLAHMAKVEHKEAHDDKPAPPPSNPFGSIFYANNARSIWYLQRSDADTLSESDDHTDVVVGFYQRKAYDRRLGHNRAYALAFEPRQVTIRPTNINASSDLSAKQYLPARMKDLLTRGALTTAAIAETLGVKPENVRKTLERREFIRLPDGRIGLTQPGELQH